MRTQIFFRRAAICVAFGVVIAAMADAQYIYPGPSPLGWGYYLFPGPCYHYNLPIQMTSTIRCLSRASHRGVKSPLGRPNRPGRQSGLSRHRSVRNRHVP
jgi:hypothetical protein